MHKIAKLKFDIGIFKAYDIRGKYPEEINEDAAYKIGRAFAGYIRIGKQKKDITIAVSADARASSPALKTAFVEGLVAEGAQVIDAGLATTPMYYFVVNETNADGGAMITASHNLKEFNGIKLVRDHAEPIGEGMGLEEIRNATMRGIFNPFAERGTVVEKSFLDAYIDFFVQKFKHLANCKIQFVADPADGMAAIVLPKLLKKFPKFKVKLLDETLDMSFPNHEANPLNPAILRDVQDAIVGGKKKFVFGVSFDGDGDRVGFVDEKGHIIKGDLMTALFAKHLAREGDVVVYDVRSSRMVKETIENIGARPVESRIGHVFVKKQMKKESAVLGGEQSGHYYFKDFFGVDSAIFALFSLIDILQKTNMVLSELIKPFQKYYKSDEINFIVDNTDAMIDNIVSYFPDAQVSFLDGAKVEYNAPVDGGASWWFSLRPSNTENLLRLNIEADSPELLEEKKQMLTSLIDAI